MAAYTRCLRCAGAPRRPASGSGLSLLIPSWHAVLSDPGESDIDIQNFDADIGLRRMTSGSALPIISQSVPRGGSISWLHWFASATACQVARPPVRIRLERPAFGDFYFQAFNGSVSLSVAGYDYNSDWTPLLAGLAPAGMAASLAAPEPYVRLSRIRLPPRVGDGESLVWPRMTDVRFGKPVGGQFQHPSPGESTVLTAATKSLPPGSDDLVSERHERPEVRRHCVVVEVAGDDLPQPFPLLGDRLMHAPPHLLFYRPELCSHAVPPGLPFDQEFALVGFAADEGEAQKVEGLRLAEPSCPAVLHRPASELDEPRLLGMQRQRKLLQPLAHLVKEAPGVALMLEADDEVVGVAHNDHVARGLALSPALGPQIEHVVQVDVGEQRRDHRSLRRPPVADRHDPVFEDAHLEPFLDQADDAPVADPVLDEADQPVLVDRVEER